MHDPANSSELSAAAEPVRRQLSGRLMRLVLKELREILRDRRTIITLVVMPLLIYPLLAVVFHRFLLTSISVEQEVEYIVGADTEIIAGILMKQLEAGNAFLARNSEAQGVQENASGNHRQRLKRSLPGLGQRTAVDAAPKVQFIVADSKQLERLVIESGVHLAVLANRALRERPTEGLHVPMAWELIYRVSSPTSEAALHYVESRLQAFNESSLDSQLRELGVVAALPATTTRHPIDFSGAPVFSLAALIPLILVLMTVTGAVYPAIDLTAGERERGTLETLIAAPVPRLGLLVAKYVAVLAVALLTALVNLAGMTITAQTTGLAASLFGDNMSLEVVFKVLLLLGLFAAFFSAILLALTSCARSFKEAQAYIIPLMLVCLVPGVLCLMPGLEFKGWMAVTPLVNIVMLARDVLEGTAVSSLAVAAVCSTILYVAAAIALAARIFGTDAILYGSSATWSDLVRRPPEPRAVAGLPVAMLGLALMFSCYFVLGTGLGSNADVQMGRRLAVLALIAVAVFGGIPIALATFGRVRWSSGLGLTAPSWLSLVAAVVFGLSLWPIAHELFLISEQLGLSHLGTDQLSAAQTMLNQLAEVSLWLILLTLALVPAVFEELSFRGFLFGPLRAVMPGWGAVVSAAVLFGVFHEALFPGRLLTSTFLGLLLGWVRLRTGSVMPCMVMHAVHNGLLLSIAHWRDELIAYGVDIEQQIHLPRSWLVLAALGIVAATGIMLVATRNGANNRSADAVDRAVRDRHDS
jgi:ABC-2 type transport system permease protein/sodium transport system permease protein